MNLWRVKIEEESGKAEGMPEPIRLPCSYAGHFTFSRDGRRMAFAAMHFFHNIQSAAFDPEAERLVTVPGPMTPPLTGLNPHVSPDGRKLAFASTGRREAIYLAGLQGEDPQQVTDGIGKTRAPRWSPDGKSLAFYSNRSGRYEIWTIAADGGGLRQMTRAAGAGAWFPDWSPDGKQISYYAVGVGSFVLRIDASGEPGPAVPLGRPDPGVLPWSWSPDGKYVALQRTTVTDLFGGFGYCRATGGDIRLLSESGGAPEWLRDSHRLLFLDAGRLKLLDIKDSRIKDLAPATNAVERIGVTPDNRVIYFVSLRTDGDIWLAQLR